jgi:hypothetical protein
VIAPLGLFEHLDVTLQLFLGRERQAIDALQLRVALVASPVRARDGGELERAQLGRDTDVRTSAQINKVAGLVKRHRALAGAIDDALIARLFGHRRRALVAQQRQQLDLVALSAPLHLGNCVFDRQLDALKAELLFAQLAHLLLDAL